MFWYPSILSEPRIMPDNLTPKQRSERMSRVKNKDSKAELRVRRIVHGMGFRYRLHNKKLPGKPDIVLARYRRLSRSTAVSGIDTGSAALSLFPNTIQTFGERNSLRTWSGTGRTSKHSRTLAGKSWSSGNARKNKKNVEALESKIQSFLRGSS